MQPSPLGWYGVVACSLIVGAAGCGQAPEGPPPALKQPVPKATTPEGKLARVMDRLKTALDSAESEGAGAGIVSQRTAASRLIQPSAPGGQLTAEVTIHTVVAVDQAAAKAMANGGQKKAGQPQPTVKATGSADAADPAGLVKPVVKDSVVELVYNDDRWQLAHELNDDQAIEQICFQYALEE